MSERNRVEVCIKNICGRVTGSVTLLLLQRHQGNSTLFLWIYHLRFSSKLISKPCKRELKQCNCPFAPPPPFLRSLLLCKHNSQTLLLFQASFSWIRREDHRRKQHKDLSLTTATHLNIEKNYKGPSEHEEKNIERRMLKTTQTKTKQNKKNYQYPLAIFKQIYHCNSVQFDKITAMKQ